MISGLSTCRAPLSVIYVILLSSKERSIRRGVSYKIKELDSE